MDGAPSWLLPSNIEISTAYSSIASKWCFSITEVRRTFEIGMSI